MAKTALPTPELLRKLLRYEPETGKLYWRERTPELMQVPSQCARWNKKYAETEAFTAIEGSGYHNSEISGYGTLLAHRVIIAMVLGYWPKCTDHDNRIRTDNRWTNLKPTTHAGNRKNYPLPSNNTSGAVGVMWSKQKQKWLAKITENGRGMVLGCFDNIEDAKAARKTAEARLGFHANHGSPN